MTRIVIAVICALACLGADGPAAAQEPRVITCGEAIDIALGRSFTVKSYQADLRATEYSYQYYQAMFKPRLDFSLFAPSLNENVSPIQRTDGLPVYNSTGMTQMGGTLTFTYMLPTGGNFALSSQMYRENLKTVLALQDYRSIKNDQAYSSVSLSFNQPIFTRNTLDENLLEARYQYEMSSNQFTRGQMGIIYSVTEAFYRLYYATRQLEIARERLVNSEEAYRIAQLKNEAGRIPEGDLLISELEMSRNRAALLESEGNLTREAESFIQLIGLEQGADITVLTDLTYDTIDIDGEKAVGEALKNRPELAENDLDIRLQEIRVDRAERQQEFKGEISAYYDLTGVSTLGSGSTADLFDSSFDNFMDRPPNRGVTLTFSYPVSDWGRGSAKVRQESVILEEKKLERENVRRTISREVRDVIRRVRETGERLIIHVRNQDIAQRSYEISRMRFENGDITSQDLGVEQERLADSQLQYLDAFISYQLAVNDLKRTTMWDFENNRSYLVDTYFQETDQ